MGAHGVEDSSAVVDALRGGGTDGLSEVYARWSPLVYSLALRSLGDVSRAEDVTKQVFTELWTTRGSVEPGRASFSAWLIHLACARIADAEAGRALPASADGGRGEESDEGRSRPAASAGTGGRNVDPTTAGLRLDLLGDAEPLRQARRFVRLQAERCGLEQQGDDAVQVTAELLSGLGHRLRPTALHVTEAGGTLVLGVDLQYADDGPPPLPQHTRAVLSHLSSDWGWGPAEAGARLWCRLLAPGEVPAGG